MNPTDTTDRSASQPPSFDEMRQRFENLSAEWQHQATEYADQAKAWVIRYPGTSLAIAAGAGLLLGWMVKRR